MSKVVAGIVGLILLFLLYQFGARQKAPEIQADIQARTSAAVAANDLPDVRVMTDGRDVTLTGTVRSSDDIGRAGSIAEDVRGVRVVDNQVDVAAAYAASFCPDESRLVLSGNVPDEAALDRINTLTAQLFHNSDVSNELTVRADAPDGVVEFLGMLLGELAQLDEGCATLSDTDAVLSGSVRSQEAADRIRSEIEAAASQHNQYSVSLDLDVPSLSDEAAACQAEYNRRLQPGENVLFDFDSAELHEEGMRLLDEIIEIGETCPHIAVWVTGHTDSVGDRAYNIDLSKRRANVVGQYLVDNGVDPARLKAIGFGFSQPVADNATEEGRALNRRIEFRVRED